MASTLEKQIIALQEKAIRLAKEELDIIYNTHTRACDASGHELCVCNASSYSEYKKGAFTEIL